MTTTQATNTVTTSGPPILFDNAKFVYEPFPVGLIKPAIAPSLYTQLVDSFPDISLFKLMPYLGEKKSLKYSLAPMNNGENYYKFLDETPVWKTFHDWIQSREFLHEVLKLLAQKNIELGIYNPAAGVNSDIPLKARFEFSVLPADGGQLAPHTDSPSKIITLVLTMVHPGEWDHLFGGGTDMLRPKRTEQNFNWVNRYLEFDECETIAHYPFEPNQLMLFVKTFNSWHCVHPMTGTGSKALRRTLTVNIEKRD